MSFPHPPLPCHYRAPWNFRPDFKLLPSVASHSIHFCFIHMCALNCHLLPLGIETWFSPLRISLAGEGSRLVGKVNYIQLHAVTEGEQRLVSTYKDKELTLSWEDGEDFTNAVTSRLGLKRELELCQVEEGTPGRENRTCRGFGFWTSMASSGL